MSRRGEEFRRLVKSGAQKAKLHTLGSGLAIVNVENIIGYCHLLTHKGFMTPNIYNSKRCREKKCPFLERFEFVGYWERREQNEKAISEKREQEKKRQDQEAELIREYHMRAIEIASDNDCPIVITRVSRRQGKERGFVINYVSNVEYLDVDYYRFIAEFMRNEFKTAFKIVRVVDEEGFFMTIEEWDERRSQTWK